MTAILKTIPFEVEFLDGRKETVDVGRLTIRQLYMMTEHLASDRMPDIVSLCVARPVEWCDTLTVASFGQLGKRCMELNFPQAATLAETDPVVAMKIARLLATLVNLSRPITPPLGSDMHNSLPAPAASESAAGSGSESLTSPPIGFLR